MAKQIEFDSLFNKKSFNDGVDELVKVIANITLEIGKAETAGKQLSEVFGTKLKKEISEISATSKTLASDLAKMTAKMDDYKAKTAGVEKVTKEYRKETERLAKELEKLKTAQEKANKETDKATPSTTKAKTSYAGLAQSMLGVASGAALIHSGVKMLTNQFSLALQSVIAFEKTMKEVQAVSGASGDELKLLTDNANKLGSTTEKTAIQVAEVQKELAKLGFSTPEILLATSAIVDLSTATGEDLVKTAEVAASTIRGFGLEVSDLGRVTDVMTKSFLISALDLEKFRESMKLVAPIASATGIGIEAVTAAMAKLSDTGISGSLAGTAVRNLLSSMADPSEELVQYLGKFDSTLKDGIKSSDDFTRALQVLKGANIDLETAVGMVDVRARTAFFTLVNYADDVEYLALELQHLNEETKRTAAIMRDTLANDIEVANSAFDSLRRNLMEELTPAFRQTTQNITEVIEAIRFLSKDIKDFVSDLKDIEDDTDFWDTLGNALFGGGSQKGQKSDWQILMDGMKDVNGVKRADEAFGSLDKNITDIIEDFKVFDNIYTTHSKVQDILTKGVKGNENAIKDLRKENLKLSEQTDDNTTFLKLLRGQTEKQIKSTYGHIAAIEAEEIKIQDRIFALKLEQETKKLTSNQTKELTNLESTLVTIRNLRFSQDEKLLPLMDKFNKVQKKQNDNDEDAIETKKKYSDITTEELKLIQEKLKAQESEIEGSIKIVEQDEDKGDSAIKLFMLEKGLVEKKLQLAETAYLLELRAIELAEDGEAQSIVRREAAWVKYYAKLTSIKQQSELETLKATNSTDQKAKESQKSAFDISMKLAQKITSERIKMNDDTVKKKIKSEEEEQEDREKIAEASAQVLSTVTRGLFDKQAIQRENELNAIDAWEQERLKLAGDNEEAKAAIEKEAVKRRNKVRLEQAKADKKEAIFQILIQTAVNIVKAWKNPLEMILAGVLGAAQVAMVAARPLPKFAKGTDFSPEGHAIVGERGRELIKDGRSGQWRMSSDGASQTYLSRGSKVIPAHITAKILEGNHDHNGIAEQYLNKLSKKEEKERFDYNEMGKQFKGAVADIPVNQTNFDENGVTRFTIKRNSKVQRLNKRY